MTTDELLRAALAALNAIPRKKLNGKFNDTYALAAEIERHLSADARRERGAFRRGGAVITLVALALVVGLIFAGEGEAASAIVGLVVVWWILSALL